jgi:NADH-quinone oxidoreductase E subunit
MQNDDQFDEKTLARVHNQILKRYPSKRAAVLPLLHLAQEQFGGISLELERYLARLLDIPLAELHGVVTFHTMFHRKPKPEHCIEVCTNISCNLLGAEDLRDTLQEKLGIKVGQTSEDNRYELRETECLGCCETAPVMMVDGELYENVTKDTIDELLDRLK